MKKTYYSIIITLFFFLSCRNKEETHSKNKVEFKEEIESLSFIANEGFLVKKLISNQKLYPWQVEISKKSKKNILDYYLLLPEEQLNAEIEQSYKTKESRLNSTFKTPINGRVNIRSGFLTAMPDVSLTMTLFKDRKNKKDIIGIELGCGEPPVQYCDYGFVEFNSNKNKWIINNSVFSWKKFNNYCMEYAKIKNQKNDEDLFWANIIFPEFGTDLKIIDAYDPEEKSILVGIWNGEKFELKKTFTNEK